MIRMDSLVVVTQFEMNAVACMRTCIYRSFYSSQIFEHAYNFLTNNTNHDERYAYIRIHAYTTNDLQRAFTNENEFC